MTARRLIIFMPKIVPSVGTANSKDVLELCLRISSSVFHAQPSFHHASSMTLTVNGISMDTLIYTNTTSTVTLILADT